MTWSSVFDKEGTSAIGSIAVANSNHNVIYVGTGEACIRGNISHGDGVYRSLDAGKTWKNIGLKDSRAIGKVIVNPSNPDIVFVAALGHPYGPNTERGIFRTTDGGKTWEKVSTKTKTPAGSMWPSIRTIPIFFSRRCGRPGDVMEYGERRPGERPLPIERWRHNLEAY